jgi:hypothetical protein
MTKVVVQLPDSIRKRAETLAALDGVSMDQLLATALAEKIAVLEAVDHIAARAARGDLAKYRQILERVPRSGVAEAWDRLPDSPRG